MLLEEDGERYKEKNICLRNKQIEWGKKNNPGVWNWILGDPE